MKVVDLQVPKVQGYIEKMLITVRGLPFQYSCCYSN